MNTIQKCILILTKNTTRPRRYLFLNVTVKMSLQKFLLQAKQIGKIHWSEKEVEEENDKENTTVNERSTTPVACKKTPVADEEIAEEDEEADNYVVNANTTLGCMEESSTNAAMMDRATSLTSLDEFLVLERLCEPTEQE